jgi:hypothetical protein
LLGVVGMEAVRQRNLQLATVFFTSLPSFLRFGCTMGEDLM